MTYGLFRFTGTLTLLRSKLEKAIPLERRFHSSEDLRPCQVPGVRDLQLWQVADPQPNGSRAKVPQGLFHVSGWAVRLSLDAGGSASLIACEFVESARIAPHWDSHMKAENPWLVSIHGIWTEGAWQERASIVFQPFFRYRAVKYGHFRTWGIVALALESLLAFFGVVLAILFFSRKALLSTPGWGAFFGFSFSLFLFTRLWANSIKAAATNDIYRQITDIVNTDPVNIIAHSMGTFLAAQVLQKYAFLSYEKVILTGCVLRRSFSWSEFKNRVGPVTNEIAGKDIVPIVASVLGLTTWPMGSAGVFGFKEEPGVVHTITPEQSWPGCWDGVQNPDGPVCRATVHNVRHAYLKHSDYFQSLHHAWMGWLPSLWGFDYVLYRDFLNSCKKIHSLSSNMAEVTRHDKLVNQLLKSSWGFSDGSLDSFIHEMLITRYQPGLLIDDRLFHGLIHLVVHTLTSNVTMSSILAGERAADSTSVLSTKDCDLLQYLEPRQAVVKSLQATLDEVKPSGFVGFK